MNYLLRLGVAVALLSLTACQKKEALIAKAEPPPPPKPPQTEVVTTTEQSQHFAAVTRRLELGGALFGYVDVDGDLVQLAGNIKNFAEQIAETQPNLAPFIKQDYGALFTSLGLTDIKAVGFSSVRDATGFYRNRAFFYSPEGRHGLLAGFGGKPAGFAHVRLAPADTDLFAETELDVPAVYSAVRDIAAKIGGDTSRNAIESALKKASDATAIAFIDLINGMKGRASFIARFDSDRTVRMSNALELPAFSLLVCVDGVAQAVETALARSPQLVVSQKGSLHLYEFRNALPIEGVKPVIAVDGGTLYFATSIAFLQECRDRQSGLAENATFREALSHVGSEGNGLVYATPRLFERLRQIEGMNATAPAQMKSSLHFALSRLPAPSRALVSVRSNLPEGILVQSYWDRSLKQEVAMISVYNPVTIGLLAAMAIPAFEKVRVASQEKAVLNNLRQLSAAADQYYLENNKKTTTYDQLVGPDKYIKAIVPVDGENYRSLRFVSGQPLRVQLRSGKIITAQ
jgi:hypothetical protein